MGAPLVQKYFVISFPFRISNILTTISSSHSGCFKSKPNVPVIVLFGICIQYLINNYISLEGIIVFVPTKLTWHTPGKGKPASYVR